MPNLTLGRLWYATSGIAGHFSTLGRLWYATSGIAGHFSTLGRLWYAASRCTRAEPDPGEHGGARSRPIATVIPRSSEPAASVVTSRLPMPGDIPGRPPLELRTGRFPPALRRSAADG
ncbi:hypothetical protein GCM10027572_19530 [Flexivirga lutea]